MSRILFIAGWEPDAQLGEPRVYKSLKALQVALPEIFDETHDTIEKCIEQVDNVNSEGNYFQFIFRVEIF